MLNTHGTVCMIVAASLAILMTPGLEFLYGSPWGANNALAVMIPCLVSVGWTTVICLCIGYYLQNVRCSNEAESILLPRPQFISFLLCVLTSERRSAPSEATQ